MSSRAAVAKTYKLYLGGAFVRSESGRTDPIGGVNVPRGSRKDIRDAVKAARAAAPGWAKKTAYNRGQVLYRFAEALESRSDGSSVYGAAAMNARTASRSDAAPSITSRSRDSLPSCSYRWLNCASQRGIGVG